MSQRGAMLDIISDEKAPGVKSAGVAAMARLTERLAAVTPPVVVGNLNASPRFSPAVTAALSRSAAMAARAERRARHSRSFIGMVVESFVSACSFIPYALVALALRLVMARVFFLDGQTRIEGPRVPFNVQDFDFTVVLPLHIKAETISIFLTQYIALPMPPPVAAALVSYGEFILPICLVFGLATRFAAFGLLLMMAMIDLCVMPQGFWSMHIYWDAILIVLLTLGAGQISADHVIRYVTRR
jgi:putative oxidoreductase